MNLFKIENKAARVKLDDDVDTWTVNKVIEEIDRTYGMKAVENSSKFGDVVASADKAIDTLEIEIHTRGGSVFDGYRVYNAMLELRNRGVFVTAKINTLAASMGSVIAMGADEIIIAPNGQMMIHEASAGKHGSADEMRQTADLLEEISTDLANIYAKKTNIEAQEIRRMMKKETWMNAKEAVALGFATRIFDTNTKAMSILDKFKPDAALVEKVSALETSLTQSETQLSEIGARLQERESDLQNAIVELATAKAELTAKASEIDTVKNALTEKDSRIAELETAVTTANESAAVKASELLAASGHVAPVEATDAIITNGDSKKKTREEFNAMTPREKSDFSKKGGRITE